MKVRDIMTSDVVTVGPETNVGDVARILREYDLSGVPVVDSDNKVLGVITELDLIARHTEPNYPRYIQIMDTRIFLESPQKFNEELRRMLAVTAEQLMTRNPPTVAADDEVDEVTAIMAEHELNPVPVVAEDGTLVGIVAFHDVLEIIERPEDAADV